ncbi:DUF421 domain-containing protein [Citreimonas salinaria]|uniref:Uncharacterized membrane protein YcaP, DUF421 family n=1 Tax=Citreimonas salinaria TaxID=321339 RepID=A0A1H3KNU7_9RHOB|nr:YetF domain-containing protein [Citreimonas salinaria]SDY53729.1 Uncharacterized membrane protein YcaP, DUF421 family [Citreimonas salinaria]
MEGLQNIQPFDWYRVFIGEGTSVLFLLEIAFRTAVMYLYALIFARFVGKRSVGQVSPFEFIMIIVISSAAGDPMFYAHVPLLYGVVVLTVVMLLHRGMSALTDKSERGEDLLEGEPILVIEEGNLIDQAIGRGTISKRELMSQLRQQGIGDVGEVEKAFFEPNGKFSIFQADNENQKKTQSTMPADYTRRPGV